MPAIPDTSVKWITSEMRGAPVLNRQPGTLIACLDAFLVTGWGLTTALSVTVADGIATATLTPGETFFRDAVVLIEGATPSALNGEARVLSMSSSSITWATAAPDGPATGTITIKYAPQSAWQKVFSGTNRAAYRSTHVQSNGHYLYVNDTGLNSARVIGYEEMADIDSGTGPFPTPGQFSGGGYWHKSNTSNDNSQKYRLFSDERLLLTCWMAASTTGGYQAAPAFGFGDPIAIAPGGDAWSTVLSCSFSAISGSSNTGNLRAHLCSSATSTTSSLSASATVSPRSVAGVGGAVLMDPRSCSGVDISGADNHFGAGPSLIDGRILTARVFVKEQASNSPPRAWVPGVRYIPQSALEAIVQDMDVLDGSDADIGRRLLVLPISGVNYVATSNGRYLVDITGPWREG